MDRLRYLIIFSGILVIITKLLDVLSTIKRIRHYSGESNPIASRLMRKFGIRITSWFIFGVVLTIMIYTMWASFDTPPGFQLTFVFLCLIISAIQGAVAISNWSGTPNAVTKKVVLIHQKINSLLQSRRK